MKSKMGIGYSSLSDTVYLGKQNQEKGMFIGTKTDITSEFIAVSFSFYEEGTIRDIGGSEGSSNLVINIKNNKASMERLVINLTKRLAKL